MSLPLLVVILGPTASGKTALSLHVAERLQGEIVSCDSVAVYREFEIGTAKPSKEDRQRVPHHLIDIADPEELVTAGDYSRLARQAISRDCRAWAFAHCCRRFRPVSTCAAGRIVSRAATFRRTPLAAARAGNESAVPIISTNSCVALIRRRRKPSMPMMFPKWCGRWK